MRHGFWIDQRLRAVFSAALTLMCALPAAADGVIPLPAQVTPGSGSFSVTPQTIIRTPRADSGAQLAARYLVDLWTRTNGLTLKVDGLAAARTGNRDAIIFRREPGLGREGYRLSVAPHRITVSASSSTGLFYGAITLWQLLPPDGGAKQIPAQSIRDEPQYVWRGLMLDSARHYQPPAFIRSMIEWMAWHKLNVLHWHLTDDQGWRLEIRKYPRLASVGAWRTAVRPYGAPAPAPGEVAREGGFYTQDEVRELVAYADGRHVQIVPEIEMPGHAQAAIAAYPELGVDAPQLPVSVNWGVHTHLFNLEPHTLGFLEDVLAEVIALFPSRYVHVGGDEAVKNEWNASAAVQSRAATLGIHDADALQAYFTQEIGRFLTAHGRRMIGWDEILRPGLNKQAIVMSWHGVAGAHLAAVGGNDTILAPWPILYLDNRQSTLASEPTGRMTVIALEEVYRFEPRDALLNYAQRQHVLGLQANLWTEHMGTERRVQWMALPRAAALAEVAWTPAARRDWDGFLERLVPMFARYRALGVNYADSVFAVAAKVSRDSGGISVALSNQAKFATAVRGDIRYTLDGREPTPQSPKYSAPVTVPEGSEIRAAAFMGLAQASRTWARQLDAHAGRRFDSHELELCSDAIGLLLQPATAEPDATQTLALDIMNPCWIERGVDLSAGPRIVAAVAPLPFNFEIGADAAKIRIGDARSADGELEIHADGCDTPAIATMPLAPAATGWSTLPAIELPRLKGRHDLCLRFARPRLDPLWALDWVEIGS